MSDGTLPQGGSRSEAATSTPKRHGDFTVDYFVDETLREGVERCPFAVSLDNKWKLMQAMLDAGLREFVIGCGPEEPTLFERCMKAKLEEKTIPADSQFVFIVLLNTWESSYDNFARVPRHYIEDMTVSFGMVDFRSQEQTLERAVAKFKALGAKKLKASILNNFPAKFDERRYAGIRTEIDRCLDLGVRTIRLNDSLGMLHPETTDLLCRWLVRDYPDIVFCLHAHNDNGLGLANALVSIYNGFRMIEGSLAGFGNRSGLPPLELVYKVCRDKNIKLGHTPIDLDRLKAAAHLAEETFMAVPNVYRPVSGIFVDKVNLGVLNIPDYLGVKGARDYFLSFEGVHTDTVRKTLEAGGMGDALLSDPEFIEQVMDALKARLKELYAQKTEDFRRLLSDIRSFYTSSMISPEEICRIARLRAAEKSAPTQRHA